MSRFLSGRARAASLGAASVLAIGLVGGPVAATEAAPAVAPVGLGVAASPKACHVTLAGTAYSSLAAAEAAAVDGATIRVRGTCLGPTIIDTDLTILGVRNSTSGVPTLSGDRAGVILMVRTGTELTLRDLTIRDGRNGHNGGAIVARGASITLRDTTISGSKAARGGAIWMEDSTLELRGASSLSGNRAVQNEGGAVYAYNSVVRMYDTSRMNGNIAREDDGGAIVLCGSDLEMFDASRLHHNTAIDDDGGAVDGSSCIDNSNVTMHDDARMDHNVALYDDGGAMAMCGGTITLNDRASIDRNASEDGGGIDLDCGGVLIMNGSSRIANNSAGDGGGIFVCGEGGERLEMNGSSRIAANTATEQGGGVMEDDCSGLDVVLTGSAAIRDNSAELEGGGLVGALNVSLSGSARISGNDSGDVGGGIYFWFTGNLTMADAAVIRGNRHAAAENGAGVSSCFQNFSGVTALTNVLDNLAPNGPIGSPASTQIWDRCAG